MRNYLKFLLLCLLAYNALSLHLDVHEADQPLVCLIDWNLNNRPLFPVFCSYNRVRLGDLCYVKCPANYTRVGEDCIQRCPPGQLWKDDGASCFTSQINYPKEKKSYSSKLGGIQGDLDMITRCQKDYDKGNCQKIGSLFYPKCKDGYNSIGDICSLKECQALGYLKSNLPPNKNVQYCQKKIVKGDPQPLGCQNIQIKDGGMCFNPCRIAGEIVFGRLCIQFNTVPKAKSWVNCDGLLFAANADVCNKLTTKNISKIGFFAMNIVTNYKASLQNKNVDIRTLNNFFGQLRQMTNRNEGFQKILDKKENEEAFPTWRQGKNTYEILGLYGYPDLTINLPPQTIIRIAEEVVFLILNQLNQKYPNCNYVK